LTRANQRRSFDSRQQEEQVRAGLGHAYCGISPDSAL
jgi:hypothetical protein